MKITSIIRYTLLTALRDWLYIGIFALVVSAIFLSVFLGGTAISEQGKMSIVYIGGAVRMITIIGLILFVCFHVRRSFDNKEIELILTRPISRTQFVLLYYAGFAVLAFTLILPIFLVMLASISIFQFLDFSHDEYLTAIKGMVFWGISFYFEALIIIAFSFFVALMLQSAVFAVLATFTFYFLARLMGFFLISIHNPASTMHSTTLGYYSEMVLHGIGTLMPRLDMFSKSEWLVYGIEDLHEYSLFLGSSFIYITLLLSMALYDFVRKQF
jgi:ABC-type transport system involved in multi-copper enzyme maturation permease subunit